MILKVKGGMLSRTVFSVFLSNSLTSSGIESDFTLSKNIYVCCT
jgi:hypothetical protein